MTNSLDNSTFLIQTTYNEKKKIVQFNKTDVAEYWEFALHPGIFFCSDENKTKPWYVCSYILWMCIDQPIGPSKQMFPRRIPIVTSWIESNKKQIICFEKYKTGEKASFIV